MNADKDLTFLFYEIFEEKKRISSYASKERKKLEYAKKENQKKIDQMQDRFDQMVQQAAADCILIAKSLVSRIETQHGEINEVKALFKIIYILASELQNREAIAIETELQKFNASIPLMVTPPDSEIP